MTIAFWCVLVAALMPYLPFGLAAGRLDPNAPRRNTSELEGRVARAYGAHLNAFENFGPFAAAVIISYLVESANSTVNVLELVFIVARFAHMGFYIAGVAPLRTLSWFAGMLMVIAIFVHSALH